MTSPARTSPVRPSLALIAALAVAVVCLPVMGAGSASAGFEPGGVRVSGVGVDGTTVKFDLGETVSLKGVIDGAVAAGSFQVADLKEARVYLGSDTPFSAAAIARDGADLPRYSFEAGRTTVSRGADSFSYCPETECDFNAIPNVTIHLKKSSGTQLAVILYATPTKVKAGQSISFDARVSGASNLSFSWDFGDGSSKVSGQSKIRHRFDRKGSFTAQVTVTDRSTGQISKAKVKVRVTAAEPKKDKKKPRQKDDSPPGGTTYNGGYGDGGYGGYGHGGNYGAPSAPAAQVPPSPEKKQKARPVDDGLVPVRGELLDPDIPAQVIDPSTTQPKDSATETQQAPDDPGGFALSGGARTAIGIAVLLGIGGLTEFRSFARFR